MTAAAPAPVRTFDTHAEAVIVRRGHGPVHIAIPGIVIVGRRRHADPTRYLAACGRQIDGPRVAVWRRATASVIWHEWRRCPRCAQASDLCDRTDAPLRRRARWWA